MFFSELPLLTESAEQSSIPFGNNRIIFSQLRLSHEKWLKIQQGWDEYLTHFRGGFNVPFCLKHWGVQMRAKKGKYCCIKVFRKIYFNVDTFTLVFWGDE